MSASTATLDKPAAKPAVGVTQHEFETHMTAMAKHYAAKPGVKAATVYALPTHLLHPVGEGGVMAAPSSAGKAAVDAALKTSQTQTTQFANQQKDAVNAATSKLQQNHDTASFAQQMQALEGQAQQQAHDNIHAQFQNLIKIGTAHPEQQSHILSLTSQIGAFFTNLIESVGQFFKDVAAKIIGWINSAIDWIKGAAATVANWVSGAVSSVEHFFGGLF